VISEGADAKSPERGERFHPPRPCLAARRLHPSERSRHQPVLRTDTVNLVSASTRSKGFVRVPLYRRLDPADDLDMSPQLLCRRCEIARSEGREICPSCGLEFRESAFLGLPQPSVYRRLARERIAALPVG
jgi:hypothetical protein